MSHLDPSQYIILTQPTKTIIRFLNAAINIIVATVKTLVYMVDFQDVWH